MKYLVAILLFGILLDLVVKADTIGEVNASSVHTASGMVSQYGIMPASFDTGVKDYLLGPGDVVNISVKYLDEIPGDYGVSVDGEIIFPELLPPVEVSGLTTKQVGEVLTQQLFEYMYEPKVNIKILERHSHKVLLLVPFQRPGKHELKREEVPLMDLIFFEAGGLTRGIRKDDELTILRMPQKSFLVQTVSLQSRIPQSISINLQALMTGGFSQNISIRNGDLIYFSSFFSEDRNVYIVKGNSVEPVSYQKDLTLLKAFLRSGISPNSIDNEQKIKIIRNVANIQDIIEVASNSQNGLIDAGISLEPEDIIVLPDAALNQIYVMGRVNNPGAIGYRDGLTLLKLILEVGGVTSDADTSKIKVLRDSEKGEREVIFGNISF